MGRGYVRLRPALNTSDDGWYRFVWCEGCVVMLRGDEGVVCANTVGVMSV